MSECRENTVIQAKTSKTVALNAAVDFIGGTVGGVANVLVGQPLDTAKVKMQTYPHLYRTSLQCLISTYKADGITRGLYRGTVPSMVANVAENSVLFCAYGVCQSAIGAAIGKDVNRLSATEKASAGSCAAFFASLVLCPTELIKCQLQTLREVRVEHHSAADRNISPFQLARQIVRTHGVQGLFRGLSSTIAREMPGYFMFFGGYEVTKSLFNRPHQPEDKLGIIPAIIAGGTGGCCFWLSVFPADVIKSRIQVLPVDSHGSFISTFRHVLRNEGIGALYSGIFPTLVRTFPATAALFLTYEYTKVLLGRLYKTSETSQEA